MSRHVLVLSCALIVACNSTPVSEPPSTGPTATYALLDINRKTLPYTPGDTATNPHALLADILTFDSYGYVTEESTIRTIANRRDTSITVRKVEGMYNIDPPYVYIMWPHAGLVTYAFRRDSLWVPVKAVNELWMYKLRSTTGGDLPTSARLAPFMGVH